MAKVTLEISDLLLDQIEEEAKEFGLTQEELIEAIFMCGLQFYNGDMKA